MSFRYEVRLSGEGGPGLVLAGKVLAEAGTERVYFTHNDKPLLSFGGQGDFIFYLASKYWMIP